MNPPPDPLDPLLERWKAPESSSLAPEVWRRVAVWEATSRTSFWGQVDGWLSRPPFAVLFVACCALIGLFLAELRVNHEQRAHSAQLARSYLQLIDPLLKANVVARLP